MLSRYLIILLLFLLFGGCKKEEPPLAPVIVIQSPYENQAVSVPEIIRVQARISDDESLEYVSVHLIDDENQAAGVKVNYESPQNPFYLDLLYEIKDISLPGGIYYVKVKASNGTVESSATAQIQLNETARHLAGFVAVRRLDFSTLAIDQYDSLMQPIAGFSLQGDYAGSGINSLSNQLLLAGKTQYNLKACDLESGRETWSVPEHIIQPYHRDDCVYSFDNKWLVSSTEGVIYGYNRDGRVFFDSPQNLHYQPQMVFMNDTYVLAEEEQLSGSRKFLASYFRISGDLIDRLEWGIDVMAFMPRSKNEIWVAGTRAGSGYFGLYHVDQHHLSTLHDFSYGPILSAVGVDPDNLLLLTAEGLYWYRFSVNSLVQIADGPFQPILRFEDLSQTIYLVRNQELVVLDYPFGRELEHFAIGPNLHAFHLRYNK